MSEDPPITFTPFKSKQEDDIETLFNNIRNRSPKIRALYSHQADILRDYYDHHQKTSDIGIELPTGSGKTLVGLLIAEWKRKVKKQRVLYLCPTRQLANQVYNQSQEYGIDTRVFTGPQKYYDDSDDNLYRTGQTIAIATYSGLFNTNPRLNDPQTIIMDDAHGSETYIGSLWSIEISRREQNELFLRLIKIVEPYLPKDYANAILQSRFELIQRQIEKIPSGYFNQVIPDVVTSIDQWIEQTGDDIKFSWGLLRGKLHACHMYISYNSILIRPYIPPTLTHSPFANADQRIFMSATLGRGGELERITGIKHIERISARSFDYSNIGRRLYIFPDLATDISFEPIWIAKRIRDEPRTLVISPNNTRLDDFHPILNSVNPKPTILNKDNILISMDPFTTSPNAVLLLSNRYDGIDLADGVCKQIIIDGLPSGTNLQEQFLEERLSLEVLLNERIVTRIQQASGRCTRSPTDSAKIIMRDRRLVNFCQRNENRNLLHPELRAEMSFSLEQKEITSSLLERFIRALDEKNQDWEQIEQYLSERRSSEALPFSESTNTLADVVRWEVDFAYSLWNDNYKFAIDCGIRVADKLSGSALSPYRALWYYFIAYVCQLHAETDPTYRKIGFDMIERAHGASSLISWFPKALGSLFAQVEILPEELVQALAIENLVDLLSSYGPVGERFDKKIDEVRFKLQQTDSKEFESGLVELGKLLGFNSFKPTIASGPDSCWQLGTNLLFILEGKSEEDPNTGVSVQDCRQSSGHLNTCKSYERTKDVEEQYVILITPRTKIDEPALAHGKEIFYLHPEQLLYLLSKAEKMLRESRQFLASSSEYMRQRVYENCERNSITVAQIKSYLLNKRITELQIFN
ncbi:MAG: DEAD/DEAH box helicase [Candidatus Hodarchaeales archaeon]